MSESRELRRGMLLATQAVAMTLLSAGLLCIAEARYSLKKNLTRPLWYISFLPCGSYSKAGRSTGLYNQVGQSNLAQEMIGYQRAISSVNVAGP